jgi:hypothetical protein
MRVYGLVFIATFASASCSSEAGTPEPSSIVSAGTPTPSSRLDPSACPVQDEAFCGTAQEIVSSLSGGEGASLVPLSRSTRIDCDEVEREYFPACASEDVLEGYGISGAGLLVEVLGRRAYRQQLEAIVGGVDATYSDELGGGSVQLIGVGTCGPDIPGRRTYHLAWTAAVAEAGSPSERLLGSFEVTFDDEEWRIALWYLDTLERWEAEQTDPLTDSFCEAGLHPWSS